MTEDDLPALANELAPPVPARCAVLGTGLSTYAIGGPLEWLAEPSDLAELAALLRWFDRNEIDTYRVLGAGSNLLIADAGLPGWTVRLGRGFRSTEMIRDGSSYAVFRVGAATSLMSLVRDLSQQGFSGLEFAGGIPASIGGAVRMNAGAHGSDIGSVITAVCYVTASGEVVTRQRAEIAFDYRHTNLPNDALVVYADLRLERADPAQIVQRRQDYLAERKRRQPLTLPSAGSVFKNPSPEQTAGALIEQAGLKGFSIGGARVSELHANWIVNERRSATASDVRAVIAHCRTEVAARFAVQLETELIYWE